MRGIELWSSDFLQMVPLSGKAVVGRANRGFDPKDSGFPATPSWILNPRARRSLDPQTDPPHADYQNFPRAMLPFPIAITTTPPFRPQLLANFAMAALREEDIQTVIKLVNEGAKLRDAAAQTNVGYGTLWGRLHGATTRNERELGHRRLSLEEESLLVSWARNEEASARPPSKA